MKNYSYIFVFYKSFEKTDIQKGELISLIELQKEKSVIHIKEIEEIDQTDRIIKFSDNLIENSGNEVVNILFLSQSALVISNFEINTREIIRRAGYVQSCGKFIFFSKWENLSEKKIQNNIVEFCKQEDSLYKIYFYEQSNNEKIESKLEGLLIDDKRYHIGKSSYKMASSRIKNFIENDLKNKISKRENSSIFIYKEKLLVKHHSLMSDFYEDRNIVDCCVCYLSQYKKDNPIHEMDEMKELKPFWSGIFTTPHRLMNAMLNLAKINENSRIIDPFCHTGTLAIEASQIGCEVILSDKFGTVGAKDNYDFLCGGYRNFEKLTKKLSKYYKENKLTIEHQQICAYKNNIKLNGYDLPEANNKVLKKIKTIDERLFFYIVRRYAMETLRAAINQSIFVYIKSYIENYRIFAKQFKTFELSFHQTGEPIVYSNNDLKCFSDCYYETNRVGYINKSKKYPKFQINDICLDDNYGIEESSLDAVITDPPYGYGEVLTSTEVTEIYTALINKSIKWLKPNGYLVFCALDKVKTGRTKDLLFTEDIIDIINFEAKKNNVKFVTNGIPLTKSYVKNVYYWKSKYALNRSVFCLQIIKN